MPRCRLPRIASKTSALADTAGTRLGRALAPGIAANPGKTGIHALPDPRDAFAGRMLLAAAADKSLDVQYYIWRGDQVGLLLFEALWKAAERGVRVRLLLDDGNTSGLDPTIAVLDAHPNIEVRLYNPFVQREVARPGLPDRLRAPEPAHAQQVVHGRQSGHSGRRPQHRQRVFRCRRRHRLRRPRCARHRPGRRRGVEAIRSLLEQCVRLSGPCLRGRARARWRCSPAGQVRGDAGGSVVSRVSGGAPQVIAHHELQARRLVLDWATAHVVQDDPAKTLDAAGNNDVLLFPELVRKMGRPEKALDIVSPYFVPGDVGTAALVEMARRGVKVRILTNSLAASDVSVVHAGYQKRRRDLLQAGVVLYELKPTATAESRNLDAKVGSSAAAGLHAKTYAVDGPGSSSARSTSTHARPGSTPRWGW